MIDREGGGGRGADGPTREGRAPRCTRLRTFSRMRRASSTQTTGRMRWRRDPGASRSPSCERPARGSTCYPRSMERSQSSRGVFVWIAIGALTVVCAVTTPDKAAHIAAIKEKAMADARNSGGVVGALGMEVMSGWTETLLSGMLEYNSYVLFSTTSAGDHAVSYGALGQVFVVKSGGPRHKQRK